MRDHIEWRANWLISEYHVFEEHYGREHRSHALAMVLGALTGLALATGLVNALVS